MDKKIEKPTLEQQRLFLIFFYNIAGANDINFVESTLKKAGPSEIKSMIISSVSSLYEMGWTDGKIDNKLTELNLPNFSSFKILNTNIIKKIIKQKKIKNQSDALIIKDALDGGALSLEDAHIASQLLIGWD